MGLLRVGLCGALLAVGCGGSGEPGAMGGAATVADAGPDRVRYCYEVLVIWREAGAPNPYDCDGGGE